MLYRQYENPYALEEQLAELREAYENAASEDEMISLAESIAELEDRINFAWQDDEYDSECYE